MKKSVTRPRLSRRPKASGFWTRQIERASPGERFHKKSPSLTGTNGQHLINYWHQGQLFWEVLFFLELWAVEEDSGACFQNVATRKVHPLPLTVTSVKLFTSGNRAVCRTTVLNKDGKAGQGKEVEYNIIGKFVISDPWNLQGQIPVSWTQMVKMV